LSAVVTSPDWLIAIGRAVGTVTDMAVAEGVPFIVPSSVELRYTGVVPEPPLDATSAALADTAMQVIIDRARARDMNLFRCFFMWNFLLNSRW
jgi:hypothetical protein